MPAILTQEQLFSNTAGFSTFISDPLRLHISGPQAILHRYASTTEKITTSLGAYSPNSDTLYAYPQVAVNSIIDLSYVKLYADSAQINYFTDVVGSGDIFTPVANYPNRIISTSTVWKANGVSYPRSGTLKADVQIGDIISLSATVGGNPVAYTTYVNGFVANTVASSVGGTSADSTNATTQTLSSSITKTVGAVTCVTGAVTASAYNGLATGDINETYDITVTVGGAPGTAMITVTSGSGRDNVTTAFTPAAFASPTAIGARGLTVTWTLGGSCSGNVFVTGEVWHVVVHQAYTTTTAASGGTYAGVNTPPVPPNTNYNTTYIVTVSRGGNFSDSTKPQITVSTTTAIDQGGPYTVSTSGSAINIGSLGVTWTPTGTALVLGDRWRIVVVAQGQGAYQTLILGQSMPTTPVDMTQATDLTVKLFVQKSGLLITQDRIPNPPAVNWIATVNNFTTKSGITSGDLRWTDGTQYPITSANLYLEYREWIATNAGVVNFLTSPVTVADINAVLGTVNPDNPLAYGVYRAMQNTAAGLEVKFTAVEDPTNDADWSNLLGVIDALDGIYQLVPLTTDPTVIGLFETFVLSQSTAETGFNKVLWVQLTAPNSTVLVNAATNTNIPVLATLTDDPNTAGTQYTLLQAVPNGTAKFITNGVQAGDTVRYLFTADGFGNTTWTEFEVGNVLSEDALLLEVGNNASVNVSQKIEVWHPYTKAELQVNLNTQAATYNNNRVRAVWPDTISDGDTVYPGYFGCCQVAGLSASVAPHQSITNVEVIGGTAVPRTALFNNSQRNLLSAGGVYVIDQDPVTGLLYSRHAVTTNTTLTTSYEEMIVRDVDAVFYAILNQLAKYIGVTNVVADTLTQMTADVQSLSGFLTQHTSLNRLGPMSSGLTITEIRQHTTLLDRVVLTIAFSTPFPVNKIQLQVII